MPELVEGHLGPSEVLSLAQGGPADARLLAHLEECGQCRDAVAEWKKSMASLLRLQSGSEALRTPDCPPIESVLSLSHPDASPSEQILHHVAACDFCGGLLRDLSEAPVLRTSSAEWQRGLARKLAGRSRQSPRFAWIAVAATIAVSAGGLFWFVYQRSQRPEILLASAFAASRPFEYRLPDAGYAVQDTVRGPTASSFDKPPQLLRAEEEIRHRLAAHPADARMLVLKGLAEIEERDYESAIQSLTHASDIEQPDSQGLTALACAYLMRGDIEKRNIDYGHALDLLLKALRKSPGDRAALFNLAIAYEKLTLLDEAAETWQRFLALPDGGWTAEARTRLENVEKIRRERKKLEGVINEDPAVFLAQAGSAMEPESYYAIFWKRWLPAVGHPEARRASEKLAGEMASRHGDTSVRDALGAYTPRASAALTQLAQVLGDVRAGKSDSAWPVAKLVLSDLERQGQRAAALRLRGEMIYMDRVQSRLGDCLGDGEAALAALRGVSYPWLAGKFRLEHAICLMEAGDSSGARAEIASASHDAEAHRLESIHIRALGFLVSSDSVSGNHEAVWQNAPAGLAEYWTSSTSHYAAQQLESDLEQSAAALGWDDAAAAIYDEVIRSASRAGNLGMEAVDRMDRAVLLKAIGDNAGENREIDAADRLFGKLPPGPEINMRLWFGRLRRAESEIDSGRAAQALPLLDALAATSGVRREADQISLDQDRGLAYYALSNWPAAASGFQQAIARNEKAPSPSPAALDSYRGLTQIQLIRNQAPAAFATWQASRVAFPSGHSSPVSAHPVIAFALLPQGVAVFRKTGETWRARMVQASTDEMERTARRFVRLCSSPSSNLGELRATGNQLYRWLLQPELAGLRDGSRVLLQTDGWIAGVPFDALTTDSGTYLGAHVITEQLGGRFPPSSADDEGLGAAAPALLVSAPSARAPGGLRLPLLLSASEEIADVRAILPNATLLEDDAATPATLRAAIPRAQIFHFAGHGWSDGGNGALILAPDPAPDSGGAPRYLTSHEISGQDWSHCSLAVLSACLTAAGESRGPVNSQSLVRAILAAGVPRVIAAKWSISSEATRSLMREFYRQLVGGAVPAQALNRAEAMLEHNARWNHPYYWAGFAVFRR